MRSTLSRRLSLAVTSAALLLASCGPFGYLKKVAKDATKAVADAKAAGAEKYAPYEYWGAVTYLEQAKVLMAYSEYERSFDYGVRAKQLAEEAKKKSDRRESGEMSEQLEDDLSGEGEGEGEDEAADDADADAEEEASQ